MGEEIPEGTGLALCEMHNTDEHVGVRGGLPSEWPALPLSQVEVSPDESAGTISAWRTSCGSPNSWRASCEVHLMANLLWKSNRGLEGELSAPLFCRVRGDLTLGLSPATSECWHPLPLVANVATPWACRPRA